MSHGYHVFCCIFINVRFNGIIINVNFNGIKGVTTNEEWNRKIKTFPGPWAEIEVPGQIILTVPSSQVLDVIDMEDLAKVYLDIMTLVNRLAGIDRRPRTERFVFDKQISGGKVKKSIFDIFKKSKIGCMCACKPKHLNLLWKWKKWTFKSSFDKLFKLLANLKKFNSLKMTL